MNWNQQMEVHYTNAATPYNSIGSFMDFFGGVTYDHVNYIFADPPYAQVFSSSAEIDHFLLHSWCAFHYFHFDPTLPPSALLCKILLKNLYNWGCNWNKDLFKLVEFTLRPWTFCKVWLDTQILQIVLMNMKKMSHEDMEVCLSSMCCSITYIHLL